MVSRLRTPALALALAAWLPACGPVEPCADGSMLESPDGLGLTEEEHALGWGDAECWHCHAEASIHRLGCTPGVDLQAVQERVRTEGLSSCASCHGDNGVSGSPDSGSTDSGSPDSGEITP